MAALRRLLLAGGLLAFLAVGTTTSVCAQSLVPPGGIIPGYTGPTFITDPCPPCSFNCGTMHFGCIIPYLGYLVWLVVTFSGGICLLMIIWGGYSWAFGTVIEDTEKGKKILQFALIGLTIVTLSYVIVDTFVVALT